MQAVCVPADKPSPFRPSFTGLPIISVALLLMLLAVVTGFRTLLVSSVLFLPYLNSKLDLWVIARSVLPCACVALEVSSSVLCRATAKVEWPMSSRLCSYPSSWQWSFCSWWSRMARSGLTDHSCARPCHSHGEGLSVTLKLCALLVMVRILNRGKGQQERGVSSQADVCSHSESRHVNS